MLTILAIILFIAAAILSRTRHASWALTLIAAGLALWAYAGGVDLGD